MNEAQAFVRPGLGYWSKRLPRSAFGLSRNDMWAMLHCQSRRGRVAHASRDPGFRRDDIMGRFSVDSVSYVLSKSQLLFSAYLCVLCGK